MKLLKCVVQYRGPFTNDWQTLGIYFMFDNGNVTAEEKQKRDALLDTADKKIGYIRIIEDEPRVVLARATRLNKKPASDDCHTYS